MNDPKNDVFQTNASETAPPPIQGRPASGRARQGTPGANATAAGVEAQVAAPLEATAGWTAGAHDGVPTAEKGANGSANGTGYAFSPWKPYIPAEIDAETTDGEVVDEGQPAQEEQVEQAAKPLPAWRKVLRAVVASRWLLVIPAFLIALYAGQLVEQARTAPGGFRLPYPPLLSWQLFAVAGLLLALATFPGKALLPSGPSAFWSRLRGMQRRWPFIGLLTASVICSLAALPLFWRLNAVTDAGSLFVLSKNWMINNGSWILYIASLVLFGLAFVVWERTVPPPKAGPEADPPIDRLPRVVEWVLILGVFALALYLRLNNLDNVPPGLWFDEAQNGVVGRGLVAPAAAHVTFLQDFTQMGALYFYLDGLMVKIFGNQIWVVRFLPALGGALIAPMLYVLGSRLYGWRAGLAAAGLVAVSSWNITFSRFGMASMPTVALDVAVFLCAAQAIRTGRLGYYAAAGVLLGLALQMYYVSRLVPLILLAVLLHRLITERMKLIRSLRVGLIVFAVGALLAFMPVGAFALEQRDAYNGRPEIVSIFNPANNGGDLNAALNQNFQRHMLMFNWLGDGNGRHNLSGSPMLDWITAALFFAGLAACVLRFWRWQYFFPVAWFVAALSGGVLTLPFEAPQSHRALEASVVTALIGGIFIGEVWSALAGAEMVKRIAGVFGWVFARVRSGRVRPARSLAWPVRFAWALSAATLLVVFWLAGGLNYHKYFEVQARDMGVWKDMYAPQAHAARVSIRYGPDHDVYMAPILKGLPPSQYLAPDVQTLDWPGMQAFPLVTNKPGGVAIILDLPSAADVALIARLYPHASFERYTSPSSPEVLIYTITIPAGDIRALQGVRVTAADSGRREPDLDKTIPDFTNDAALIGSSAGTVRLSASLKVDAFGTYSFAWQTAAGSPSGDPLYLDGTEVEPGKPLMLGQGLHSLSVTTKPQTGSGVSVLMWDRTQSGQMQRVPPISLFDARHVEPHGLTGWYRLGAGLDSPPANGRVDPVISFNWHRIPTSARPYTAEWIGKLYIPQDGQYSIGTEQLSTSKLFLDGEEILTNNSINNLMEHQAFLTTGLHDLRIVYSDQDNYSHMYLYWTPPGRNRSIIPSAFLWPALGAYPDKPGSGDWPTLADSDGSQLPSDRVTYFPPRSEEAPAQSGQGGQQAPLPPAAGGGQSPAPAGEPLKPLFTVGDKGVAVGVPRAAAADSSGNIYIFAETDSKIHKFDPSGKELSSWKVASKDGAPLPEASAIIVSGDKVMLLDSATSDLLTFTPDGSETGRQHLCQCFFPRSAALARDGNIWIANTGGGQVLKISLGGKILETVGDKGTEPGKFIEPGGVWEEPDGTLFVTDIGNKRVQVFSAEHKPMAQWNMGNSVARDGNRVVGDGHGNLLVTQSDGTAIVRYNREGKELARWYFTRSGGAPAPSGIASLGGDKFIALYPTASLAAVFSIK